MFGNDRIGVTKHLAKVVSCNTYSTTIFFHVLHLRDSIYLFTSDPIYFYENYQNTKIFLTINYCQLKYYL